MHTSLAGQIFQREGNCYQQSIGDRQEIQLLVDNANHVTVSMNCALLTSHLICFANIQAMVMDC